MGIFITGAKGGFIVAKNDKILTWNKPKTCPRGLTKAEFAALPKTQTIREVFYSIEQPGFRTQSVSVLTTLLDIDAFPTLDLTQLYCSRWHVELDIKHLKTSLGMDILRCKTPDMVRKEIYAFLLVYNLLRSLMWDAGTTYNSPPLRLSLQGTRQQFDNFIPQFFSVCSDRVSHLYLTLLKVIVHKTVPSRPGRVEPRVVKRRPKAYPWMHQPRSVLRQVLLAT